MAKQKTASAIVAPMVSVSEIEKPVELSPENIPHDVIEPEKSKPFLVKEAFGNFQRGSVIADPELIKKVLASPQARFIIPMENN